MVVFRPVGRAPMLWLPEFQGVAVHELGEDDSCGSC